MKDVTLSAENRFCWNGDYSGLLPVTNTVLLKGHL